MPEQLQSKADVKLSNTKINGDPDLHLTFDGRRSNAIGVDGSVYTFAVPPSFVDVGIVSRHGDGADDERRLGVAIGRVLLRAGHDKSEIPVDHPLFREGFHASERDGLLLWRWTDGKAHLPAALLDVGGRKPSLIELRLHARLPGYHLETEEATR